MYKSKLQEICQQRAWTLPVYDTVEEHGLDHCATFSATVTLNDQEFYTLDEYISYEEAQNSVAKLAFDHFSNPSPSPSPSTNFNPNRSRNFTPNPNPSHNPNPNTKPPEPWRLFFSRPLLPSSLFSSSEFFPTLKEAEQAAAKVALTSLSSGGVQEHYSGLYKNLLQELVRKDGIPLPRYSTISIGGYHVPIFVSIVTINEDVFTGEEARRRKDAEMNAAKVAYNTLNAASLATLFWTSSYDMYSSSV